MSYGCASWSSRWIDGDARRLRGRNAAKRRVTIGIHQPEQSQLGDGSGSERGRRAADRLPEEREPAKKRLALELELHVAVVVQEHAERSGGDAEPHQHLEEAYRRRARPPPDEPCGHG